MYLFLLTVLFSQAIVGELNLDDPQFIEVCTVGTAGTQSEPVRVSCTANVPVSPRPVSGSRLYTSINSSPENTMSRSRSRERKPRPNHSPQNENNPNNEFVSYILTYYCIYWISNICKCVDLYFDDLHIF